MTASEFLDSLCDAMSLERGHIKLDDHASTAEWWDSISHMAIIATIDSELQMNTQDDPALIEFSSIREIISHLEQIGALEQ